jgi:uncharacterized protein
MKCPQDGSTLVMSERSGVEIDCWPRLPGVWLDRGELDKILDRTEREGALPQQRASRYEPGPTQHKRKKNWLSEVFEFSD